MAFGKKRRKASRKRRKQRILQLLHKLEGERSATRAQRFGKLAEKHKAGGVKFAEMIRARQLIGTSAESLAASKRKTKLEGERGELAKQLAEEHKKRMTAAGF